MGLFRRVGDMVSANLNDLVERFESLEMMLRQAIREMDAALERTMEATARAIADERLLENQLARCRTESTRLQRLAREAVARGDDQAARGFLYGRQDQEKLLAALDDQLAATRTAAGRLRRRLEAMRVRRSEAERRLHALVARERAAEAQRRFLARGHDQENSDTGYARFERMQRRVERREAETEALLELSGSLDPLEPTTAGALDAEIEAELQALRGTNATEK